MSRDTYKILSIIGLVGAGLLTLSFFLPIIQGDVQVGEAHVGYHATGYQLTRGEICQDALSGLGGGSYFIYVGEAYHVFYALLLIGLLAVPLTVFKVTELRFSAALCGLLGIICASWGYVQFDPGTIALDYGPGFGLYIALIGGLLLIVTNTPVYMDLRSAAKAMWAALENDTPLE